MKNSIGCRGFIMFTTCATTGIGHSAFTIVIIHTLFNQAAHHHTNYRFLKGDGKLRILKMSENIGWRDVSVNKSFAFGRCALQGKPSSQFA